MKILKNLGIFLIVIIVTFFLIFNFAYLLNRSSNESKEEWLAFKKSHQCVLKQIDNTSIFGHSYLWLCDDGVSYKNLYSEKE